MADCINDGEWLAMDLGLPMLFYSIWLFWERAYAGSYELQRADSLKGPWTRLISIQELDGKTDVLDSLHAVTQYMRLLLSARATCNGNLLWEFEARDTQDPVCIAQSSPVQSSPARAQPPS
jgi:hypothetical protein